MSDYYVGPQADYESPQAAIDQLLSDVGAAAFTEQHNIVITNGAVYEGYTVEGLTPTAVNRLVITAATADKPILIPQSNGVLQSRCVRVAAPYVTIERQEMRGGLYGVVANGTATGLNLKQILVRDPYRIGVLVDDADEFVMYNSLIYAPNTCFVGRNLQKAGLFFNTMKNGLNAVARDFIDLENIIVQEPGSSVVWLSKKSGDSETIYVHDNNLVSVAGPVFAVDEATTSYLDSDYNNLYSPRGQVAMIVPGGTVRPMRIEEWRTKFSLDENSITEDPRFYNAKIDGDTEDGIYQDLRIRPASLLRARAESNSVFGDYPSFVPDAHFTGDIDDDPRSTPRASIGAYELQGSILNYWDNIVPAGSGNPHADIDGIFEAAKAHYATVVKPWYPKLKTGFFWARDNLFYLYSDKQTARLDQLRWFKFSFTGDPIADSVTAYFNSGELTSNQWDVMGDYFYFKSSGFSVNDGDAPVEVSGEQLVWNSGENKFDTGEFYWSSIIDSGEAIYVLEVPPVDGAPIVVTDGSIDPSDSTGDLPFGFNVTWDEEIGEVVMTFQSGELPEERFMGSVADNPYVVNDFISNFTWGAFAVYGDYVANFPGLETYGVFTRSFEFEELTEMTVEWEGSKTGIYEITDLSMNPIHNSQTDGFLAIRNIHAHIWDRTLPSGESTLHDDWLGARTGEYDLPWAKVTGKNKWRPLVREFSAPIPREAALVHPTGELYQIDSVPGPLVALQGTTGEEVLFTCFDLDENPWAFELLDFALSSSQGGGTGEFPGYIAQREFGLYTRLGSSFTCETDVGGHVALRYIPPPANSVTLYDPDVITGEGNRWIPTRYDIYPDNHGNPTFRTFSGEYLPVTGEVISGDYTGEMTGGYYYYDLDRYPDKQSGLFVLDGVVRQQIVYHDDVQDGQVFVDYENKQLKSKSDGPLHVRFTPLTVWRDPDEYRKLYLHADFELPDKTTVAHDAWMRLTASKGTVSQVHDIVCRNPYDTGEY